MIRVYCDSCDTELTEAGGLILSPPDVDGNVLKQHLCLTCYSAVEAFMFSVGE